MKKTMSDVVDLTLFGGLLREIRLQSSKSIKDLARYLNCSTQYISDVELGKRAPLTMDLLIKTCYFLNCDLDELVLARAKYYGYVEVLLTGNKDEDEAVVAMAVKAALIQRKG